MEAHSRLNVGIIGTGKLGTDLLLKLLRSPLLNCILFAGRNAESPGIRKATSLGVNVSHRSIDAISTFSESLDLVFDVTTAAHHPYHAQVLREANIKAIDLTPAKVGEFCIPSINPDTIITADNVNLVTCGGQASIPVIHVLSSVFPDISAVQIHSHLAEDSVGPGTLANIDEYYASTAHAITHFSGIQNVSVDLQVERSSWKPDMVTVIRAQTNCADMEHLYAPLMERLNAIRSYVPGYQIVGTPKYRDGEIEIVVSVRGLGDWIPSYAGNLDIINCAAIAVAERYAASLGKTGFIGDADELPSEEISSIFSRIGFGRSRSRVSSGI